MLMAMLVRRALSVLACAGLVACEADTQGLDPGDGGLRGSADALASRDAEPAPDRDPPDLGPPLFDAGPDAGADGGFDAGLHRDAGGTCPIGPVELSFRVTVVPERDVPEERIRGRARVETWLPELVLVFDSGQRVTIEGTLWDAPWPEALSPVVEADVLIRRPFWTEVSFHLRSTLGARPFPIASLTGWSHSRDQLDVGPTRPMYFPSPCAEGLSCGPASPMHMHAMLPDGSAVFAPAGERSDMGAVTVMNSASSRQYLGAVVCDDLPVLWTAGMVIDRGT